MPNRRYHMHIAYAADLPAELLDSLAVFFEQRAFLTYDLLTNQPITVQYSRRCIDECDYVLVLIADSYGIPNITGVSQLHLSYIYAKTKHKPMMVLIKSHSNKEGLSRHLQDFINLVEQQASQVYYYENSMEVAQILPHAFDEMLEHHPSAGWLRGKDGIETAVSQTLLRHYQHSSMLDKRSPNAAADKTAVSQSTQTHMTNTQGANVSHTTIINEKIVLDKLKKLQDKPIQNDELLAVSTGKSTTIAPMTHTDTNQMVTAKDDDIKSDSSSATVTGFTIRPDGVVSLRYTAHAYEGSNLREVSMMAVISWRELLQALMQIPSPFTNYGMQRCLNGIIVHKADRDIKKRLPKVHAVTRCQVIIADMKSLQGQMKEFGFIDAVDSQRQARELWRLTDRAEQLAHGST